MFILPTDAYSLTALQFTTGIPTILPYPSSGPSSGSQRAIITGSAIGGTAFVIILAALILFLRRSDRIRMNYKKLRVFGGRSRRRLLEDEDDDDAWGAGPSIGTTTTQYRDYPASVASSAARPFTLHDRGASTSRAPSALSSIHGHNMPSAPPTPMHEFSPVPPPVIPPHSQALPPQAYSQPYTPPPPVSSQSPMQQPHPPYLTNFRTGSSGSIFHEAVWPPPGGDFMASTAGDFSGNGEFMSTGDVSGPTDMGGGTSPTQRVVTYGTPVVVNANASGFHGRAPSQAGLLTISGESTTSNHHENIVYERGHGRVQSQAALLSFAPELSASSAPADTDQQLPPPPAYELDERRDAGTGSPVPMEATQLRLFVKNGEPPLSPSSPTQSERGFAAAQAQAQSSGHVRADSRQVGGPARSARWLDRHRRKE